VVAGEEEGSRRFVGGRQRVGRRSG
jgi:hypothetical protein